MPKEISKEMEANIRRYGEKIKTIEDFVEVVRKMPGMYIGHLNNKGFLNMIREILQNSIDQLTKGFRGKSTCSIVKVSYDENTHVVIVEDDGNGIPFDKIDDVFSKEHTSANYTKEPYDYTSGMHGVGAKVTKALTDTFIVESYILGDAIRIEYKDGHLNKKEKIPCNGRQGTKIIFHPAYEVMHEIDLSAKEIYDLCRKIISLINIGAVLEFNWVDLSGKSNKSIIKNEEGIISNLYMICKSPLMIPIKITNDTGEMKADMVFTYDVNDMNSDIQIVSFSNCCPTLDESEHVKGFVDGVTRYFRNYMNKIYLGEKSKIAINNFDIRTGLKVILSCAHLNPIFSGQAKEILSNKDMRPFVANLVYEGLREWEKACPNDLQKVAKYLKDVAEIRMKSEQGKEKLSTKYESSVVSGLPKKYCRPNGTTKKGLEFLIVEGDSALASAKNSRDHNKQGILPIRGKMPNAFTTEKVKFLSNSEVAGIITIVGGGYGKNFDIAKVLFEKVIIMADADPDGSHIQTLVLSMFLLYMLPLIEHGRLFKAVPPLFGFTNGKKNQYFTDKSDYVGYVQKSFSKSYNLYTNNNIKLGSSEIMNLLYRNIDYKYYMDIISSIYAISPNLLEMVLLLKNTDFKTIKNTIERSFRFINVSKDSSGTIIIKGLNDLKMQTLFINDRFLNECKIIIDFIHNINKSNIVYKIDNRPVGLYEIMSLFEKAVPNGIQRYKGLGEMDPDELAESTLHPDSNRTLIQYTVESARQEIELIREIQSDKSKLLTDLTITRQDIN